MPHLDNMDKTPNQVYASIQPFVETDIRNAIQHLAKSTPYKTNPKPNIRHTGVDAPRIDPKDLLGFPIVTSVPSYKAPQGTWVFVYNATGPTLYLYVMLNGTWTNLSYHL